MLGGRARRAGLSEYRRDFGGDLGHELVHWALLRHTQQFPALRLAQLTRQSQHSPQAIQAGVLLARIAIDADLDAGNRDLLVLGMQKDGQCRARAEGGIVQIVRSWPRSLAALRGAEVRGKTVRSDVDDMPHRGLLIANDSDRHGSSP